jgi:hypothetical protein
MTMGEYDSSVALAQKRIKKKGQPVVLRHYTTAALPDPDKPWVPGERTQVDQTVMAVWLDYSQQYIDGETIRTGDQRVFMPSTDTAGNPIDPGVDYIVVRGSQIWKVVRPKPLQPGEQTVMFEVQLRQ